MLPLLQLTNKDRVNNMKISKTLSVLLTLALSSSALAGRGNGGGGPDIKINFQRSTRIIPNPNGKGNVVDTMPGADGFSEDSGLAFDPNRGYGWVQSNGAPMTSSAMTVDSRLRRGLNGAESTLNTNAYLDDGGIHFTSITPGTSGNGLKVVIVNPSTLKSTVLTMIYGTALSKNDINNSDNSGQMQVSCITDPSSGQTLGINIANPTYITSQVVAAINQVGCGISAVQNNFVQAYLPTVDPTHPKLLAHGVDAKSYDNLGFIAAGNMPVRAIDPTQVSSSCDDTDYIQNPEFDQVDSTVGIMTGTTLDQFYTSSRTWEVFPSLPGWTVSVSPSSNPKPGDMAGVEIQKNGIDGTFMIELDSNVGPTVGKVKSPYNRSNVQISQVINIPDNGQQYNATIKYRPRRVNAPGSSQLDAAIVIRLDGQDVTSSSSPVSLLTAPNPKLLAWQLLTLPLPAGQHTLSVEEAGQEDGYGSLIGSIHAKQACINSIYSPSTDISLNGLIHMQKDGSYLAGATSASKTSGGMIYSAKNAGAAAGQGLSVVLKNPVLNSDDINGDKDGDDISATCSKDGKTVTATIENMKTFPDEARIRLAKAINDLPNCLIKANYITSSNQDPVVGTLILSGGSDAHVVPNLQDYNAKFESVVPNAPQNVTVTAGDPYFVDSRLGFVVEGTSQALTMMPLSLDGSGVRADFQAAYQDVQSLNQSVMVDLSVNKDGSELHEVLTPTQPADASVISRYCVKTASQVAGVPSYDCALATPRACVLVGNNFDCSTAATHFTGSLAGVNPVVSSGLSLVTVKSATGTQNNKISSMEAQTVCAGNTVWNAASVSCQQAQGCDSGVDVGYDVNSGATLICTTNGWNQVASLSNLPSLLALGNDLDFTGTTALPIPLLTGEFDGQNHTISNFSTAQNSVDMYGYQIDGLFLFAAQGAVIADLNLVNAHLATNGGYAGLVAEISYANLPAPTPEIVFETSFQNVNISNSDFEGTNGGSVGSFVGWNAGNEFTGSSILVTFNTQSGTEGLQYDPSFSGSGCIVTNTTINSPGGLAGVMIGENDSANETAEGVFADSTVLVNGVPATTNVFYLDQNGNRLPAGTNLTLLLAIQPTRYCSGPQPTNFMIGFDGYTPPLISCLRPGA